MAKRRDRLAALIAALTIAGLLTAAPAQAAKLTVRNFNSPSGNIGCEIDGDGVDMAVHCYIKEFTYAVPANLGPCSYGLRGPEVSLSVGGRPTFDCVLSLHDYQGFTLLYGSSTSVGPFDCASAADGIRCVDTTTNHGFRVAKESYDFF